MCPEMFIKPNERLDDLQNHGLKILQDPAGFCFGMDAVLLAYFTRLRSRDHVTDLGTGTGILPLLMSRMAAELQFEALEWQPEAADMARRSVQLNGLEACIRVHCADARQAPALLGYGSMDGVVCNPPYGKRNGTVGSEREAHLLARHETDCTLEELIQSAAVILKNRGRFWVCFPPVRALELMDALRAARLEPKRIRTVCVRAEQPPYLLLVEAAKNAKPQLVWLPPLIVHDANGHWSPELQEIYQEK